ncbi:MAG: ATP-dependent RecD-like DNA helicase [Parachlamydiaceae bacterium]|nr:ATP-dependent RecD-like DNA helicase [Parachlamydiaceae bacterium]
MEQISGFIERITFQNSENGYTIAQLNIGEKSSLVCVVGIMPDVKPGETLRCFGTWKNHLVHGRQFEVSHFKVETPADELGIRKYLSSGLIRGIGKKYADKIVDQFGVNTLTIIEENPEKLLEVQGLGAKRVEKIKSCWIEQHSIRDVMVFLQSYGVSPGFAQKIFKTYGKQSIAKVKENPYTLAQDIFRIGFKTADTLAQKMGIPKDSPVRLDAGIEYILIQMSGEGHTCFPLSQLKLEAEKMFEAKPEQIDERVAYLKENDRIEVKDLIVEGKKECFVWLITLFRAEIGIVRELKRLKKGSSHLRSIDPIKALKWVQEELNIELAKNQQQAVASAFTGKLQIITGGPGTGKSTITKAILAIASKLTSKIALAAPTGRAAKRMSEVTQHKATTLHSLLSYQFKTGGFKFNRENPLDIDLIIIDEASMIDTYLMFSVLKAIPDHARVIFVGDINQLPSVGAGNVLNDMIHSLTIPVTTLNEIFRQAAGSAIIMNAHKINQGKFPELYHGKEGDFFFIEGLENQDVLHHIIKLVSQRLPNKYGYSPTSDIQVLTPMKKGIIGTENLNQKLQEILNPKEFGLFRNGQRFQIDDKVMQIRNDYKKEVFNGDIGYILAIDPEEQEVIIKFEDREVPYEYSDLDSIVLAYAISIHKSQGSEYPVVVIPVHTSHFMMLHRNLLYTGLTRGKKLVIFVGTKKAIAIAVKNNHVQQRYTALLQTLMEFL